MINVMEKGLWQEMLKMFLNRREDNIDEAHWEKWIIVDSTRKKLVEKYWFVVLRNVVPTARIVVVLKSGTRMD